MLLNIKEREKDKKRGDEGHLDPVEGKKQKQGVAFASLSRDPGTTRM